MDKRGIITGPHYQCVVCRITSLRKKKASASYSRVTYREEKKIREIGPFDVSRLASASRRRRREEPRFRLANYLLVM